MAVASREASTTSAKLTTYVERGMEVLWLLTAAFVPLIFVPTDYMLSEAINAYVEVPKTTALRTLVGMMTILWIVEWVLKGGLTRKYSPGHYLIGLKNWLVEQPSRWVVVAATFYVVVAIIATLLSTSFWISMWGEVSGQFGYSAYTTVSYFFLFAIIATHLKTRPQLWRLLGIIVVTGALVALYGIIQHYDLDPLDLGEGGSRRISAGMANPVFAGSFLVITTLMTIGVGLTALDRWGWTPLRIILWVALIAAQFMAVYWTGSRGSWLLGVPAGLVAFLALPTLIDAISTLVRGRTVPIALVGLLVLLGLLGWLVLMGQLNLLNLLDGPGLAIWRGLSGLLILLGVLSLLVLVFPARFSSGLRTFTKIFLTMAAGLLILLAVLSLEPTPFLRVLLPVLSLLGVVSFLVLQFARSFALVARFFAKAFLILASGLLIALILLEVTPAPSSARGEGDELTTDFSPAQERFSSTRTQAVRGGGLSYRTDIWGASVDLVVKREWFEFEDLSISFIRPLIGYGPELFKYTFPLESPLGGLLSHAHNFFLHHAVEQGILGLLSSLGLFIAFFVVGLAQLWRNWEVYSTTHKWILITLLATMVGRVVELISGVAREPDISMFWILLAIFVVLPSVMSTSPDVETSPAVPGGLPRPPRRQERRGSRPGRRERRARPPARSGIQISPLQATVLVLVSAVVIFIGWLTWDKNVDYAWAAQIAASSRDRFQEENFQESHRLMSKAIDKAPDVPIYYHNLSGIYDSYRQFAISNPDRNLQSCEQFFSLEPRADRPQSDRPYAGCAEEAYLSNLMGFRKNSTSPQAKLVLANSTLQLALLDREAYKGKDEEVIRYYDELTKMIPASWPLHNALGTAFLRLGRPSEALAPLENSLVMTKGAPESAQAYYLKGLAHRSLEETQKAIDSFERSLAVSSNNPNADEIRRQLVNAYNAVAAAQLEQNQAKEALEPLERSLAITQGSSSSGAAFYYQGIAYRQLNELAKAADSFERSLAVDETGPNAVNVHQQLAEVYAALGDQARSDEHAKLYEELKPG